MSARNDQHYLRKWAVIAFKGGLCVGCKKPISWADLPKVDFHHVVPIGNGADLSDRWQQRRYLVPFTPEWFEWVARVEPVHRHCHALQHTTPRPERGQMTMEEFWEVQQRLDEHAARNGNGSK